MNKLRTWQYKEKDTTLINKIKINFVMRNKIIIKYELYTAIREINAIVPVMHSNTNYDVTYQNAIFRAVQMCSAVLGLFKQVSDDIDTMVYRILYVNLDLY